MRIGVAALLAASAWCFLTAPAICAPAPDKATAAESSFLDGIDWHLAPTFSATAGIGYITATSGEYVYDTPGGGKVSQLNWRIQNALVAKGTLGVSLTSWLSASFSGWTKISSNNLMDDYDWLVPPYRQWSDHSHSPDTKLGNATQGDFSLSARVYNDDGIAVRVGGGYQWTVFKWRAYGGHYVYSDLGFRDLVGDFPPGELGIAYSQYYSAPYLGLSGTYDLNADWQLNAALKWSPWATAASDADHHVLRSLFFKDKSYQSHLFAFSAGATYALNARTDIEGTIEYQRYALAKGPTTVLDETSGATFVFPGKAAGLKNDMFMASIGVRYRFDP